jgi:hypothetical protein
MHTLILIGLSVFFIPKLFSPGMFFDGAILTSVAINLADNFTGFHNLTATPDYAPVFCDQPPIYFWVYGLFYKLFGHGTLSIYVAKLIPLLCTLYLLTQLNNDYKKLFATYNYAVPNEWLVLVYVASALHGFVFENLMVESLLIPIALLSVLQLNKFITTHHYRYWWAFNTLLFVLLYTKGVQTQFVVAYLGCYALVFNTSKLIQYTLLGLGSLLISAGIFVVMFYVNDSTHQFFVHYWYDRIYPSFNHAGEATTNSHFGLLYDILQEYIFTFLLLIIAYYVSKDRRINYKISAFLLLFAACGILPLMVTLEQRRWYFAQAAPFLLLGITYIIIELKPAFVTWLNTTITGKGAKAIVATIVVANVITIALLHTYHKRDTHMITLLQHIKHNSKQRAVVLHASVTDYPELSVYAPMYDINFYRRDTALAYTVMYSHDSLKHKTVYANTKFALVKN